MGPDTPTNCDPFVVCYSKNDGEDKKEIGRTEVMRNNVNPTFREKFTLRYQFEVSGLEDRQIHWTIQLGLSRAGYRPIHPILSIGARDFGGS